jgi:hypothetical protein
VKHSIGWGGALVALSLLGCGHSDSGPAGAAGSSTNAGGSVGGNRDPGSAGSNGGAANGSGASGTAGDSIGPDAEFGPKYFRFGVNGGYYGPGIDRRESAQMSVLAGASSLRTTLPEYYLAKWGDEIESEDYAHYETLGLGHHACFLIGPTAPHSTAPAGVEDWELAHYAPKNLYEPIFLDDGSVNPDNYWAAYVERVAKTYGPYLDIYEVWNEPDQVGGNWQATQAWETTPPKPSDLIWWNDSIFAYVRLLRITHEVVHRFDDRAAVTTGGIGYGSFLSALLRYTDEPKAGSVSDDYPKRGGQYLDIVSYHYYPVFGGGSSDRGVDGLLEARDDYEKRLSDAGEAKRKFVVTENGAPRYAVGDYVGGEQYSANYLIKSMVLGHYAGLLGIDWFAQGDGAAKGASMDSFDYMGLYFDYSQVTAVADTSRSPQGDAYAWLSEWLAETEADPQALSALSLPSGLRGAAFKKGDVQLLVLWAKTEIDESATATYELATDVEITLHSFQLGSGAETEQRAPRAGRVKLELTGMPVAVEVP